MSVPTTRSHARLGQSGAGARGTAKAANSAERWACCGRVGRTALLGARWGSLGTATLGSDAGRAGGHVPRRLHFPQLALRRRLGQLSCMSRPALRLRSWPLTVLYYLLPFGALRPLSRVGWRPVSRVSPRQAWGWGPDAEAGVIG